MNNIHTPERLANESFEDYKARRKESQTISDDNRNIGFGGQNTRKMLRDNLRKEGKMHLYAGGFGRGLRNWINRKQKDAL